MEANSHSITLNWTDTNNVDNSNVSYAITWKDITDGSKNGCAIATNNSYVINNLEACVTFEVSVRGLYGTCSEECETFEVSVCASYESCNVSEAAIGNATTLSDGKWHVMCRFMTCAYTTSYSECIQYSHQLKFSLQISHI